MKLFEDHIWPLALCFVAVLTAFTVMSVTGHGGDGTLLRAVILSLGGAVAGYAAGNKS